MMSNAALDELALQNDARQGERALREVYDFLGRFVAYPSEHAHVAHALWVLHSHLMDRWDTTPRLAFLSAEPASGKSRALEITELLVPNAVATVNASPAYIFRRIGGGDGPPPTILFDEVDTIFGPKAGDNEDLRGLLNAGHRRGAMVGRCITVGKTVETQELSAFSAAALAGLHWLPDTLLSRSVIIRMRRRRPDEKVEPFRHRVHKGEGYRIQGLVEVWAGTVPAAITEWPALPAQIADRDADVWEPLITCAQLVGGEWPARARAAAVSLVKVAHDVEPSLGLRLLADIQKIFVGERMVTSTLVSALLADEEAPWGDIKGKPLDPRVLARMLREYEIRPKVMRVDTSTIRGYERTDFEDVWARFCASRPEHVTTETAKQVRQNRLNGKGPVSHVALVTRNQGEACPVGPGGPDDDLGDFQ